MTVTMNLPIRNAAQEELRAWSEVDDDHIDVGAAALAFAALRQRDRDTGTYRNHLDRLSAEVGEIAAVMKPQRAEQVAGILREVITLRHGYKGDITEYDSPDNANMMKVIDRRRGLPVALGAIYLSVARANGWDARGLSFPEHFLLRLEFGGRRVVIDPFAGGVMVAAPQLRAMVKEKLGKDAELRPEYYAPVSNREVLLRLQNNLKLRFVRAGLEESAAEVLEGMLLLSPERAQLWREYGMLLARLGQEHRAIIALENFLVLGTDEHLRHQTAALVEQLRSITALGA